MTDEHALLRDTGAALGAQSLLDNGQLKSAFAGLEEAYTAAWRSTRIDDVTGREKLFLAINVVGKVRDHLQAIVNNGKLAQAELRALAETAEREKRWENVK